MNRREFPNMPIWDKIDAREKRIARENETVVEEEIKPLNANYLAMKKALNEFNRTGVKPNLVHSSNGWVVAK